MTLPAVVTPPPGYPGSFTQWVQVVVSSSTTYSNGDPPNKVCTGSGLDTRYPYTQRAALTDSPSVPSLSWANDFTVADSFTSYLMWNPGTPAAIFVAVAQVPWSWSAEATQSDQGSWPTNWSISNVNTPNPQPAATTTFPIWSKNVLPQSCN